MKHSWIFVVVLLEVAFGVANYVSYYLMAQRMEGARYDPFLLYTSTAMGVLFFGLGKIFFERRNPSYQQQQAAMSSSDKTIGGLARILPHLWPWYLAMALVSFVTSVLQQVSDQYVSGDVQSILSVYKL
jgi:hypothetical protein